MICCNLPVRGYLQCLLLSFPLACFCILRHNVKAAGLVPFLERSRCWPSSVINLPFLQPLGFESWFCWSDILPTTVPLIYTYAYACVWVCVCVYQRAWKAEMLRNTETMQILECQENNTHTCSTQMTFPLMSSISLHPLSQPSYLMPILSNLPFSCHRIFKNLSLWDRSALAPLRVLLWWSRVSLRSLLPNKDLLLMKVTDSFLVCLSFRFPHFPFRFNLY
jgi:hypothetical protein